MSEGLDFSNRKMGGISLPCQKSNILINPWSSIMPIGRESCMCAQSFDVDGWCY